jgi:hypothetical protein
VAWAGLVCWIRINECTSSNEPSDCINPGKFLSGYTNSGLLSSGQFHRVRELLLLLLSLLLLTRHNNNKELN